MSRPPRPAPVSTGPPRAFGSRTAVLLAALAGLLAHLAFPRTGLWPLVFVAPVPLLLALTGRGARQRLLLGWLAGALLNLLLQRWFAGMLVRLGGFPPAAAVAVHVVYAGALGLQWGLFALGAGWLRARPGWLVSVPLLFAALERFTPALFPYSLASALYPAPVLLQTAELAGLAGPAFLALLVSCALADAAERLRGGRRPSWRVSAAAVAAWGAALAWGGHRQAEVLAAPPRAALEVAIVQPSYSVGEKLDEPRGARGAAWERAVGLLRDAAAGGGRAHPDLVVLPEGGFPYTFEPEAGATAPTPIDGESRRRSRELLGLVRELGSDLVVGAATRGRAHPRNSAVHLSPAGSVAVYDKVRLVPVSERVPLGDRFPSLRAALRGVHHQEPGRRRPAFRVAGVALAPGICYETIFPGDARAALDASAADLLLNLTNDVWFGDTAENEQHLMLQVARAIENRVWLVRGATYGISAFVDPAGGIRAQARVGEAAVLARRLEIADLGPTIFRRHGDLALLTGIAVAAALAARPGAGRGGIPPGGVDGAAPVDENPIPS